MKQPKIDFDELHRAFESRVRLGIMSILAVNERVDFNTLKEYLNVSDGNLASHLKALEKENFIHVNKLFIGRKPNTQYSMTREGKNALEKHLKSLEILINSHK
ncbi:MAG TPA: transcriptional regulator [Saprospiraceae bacterium]|nr:transcriptional regulator [Saprospiraceae bacterium]